MTLAELAQYENPDQAIFDAMTFLDSNNPLLGDIKMLFLFMLKDRIDGKTSDLTVLSKKVSCTPKRAEKYMNLLVRRAILLPEDVQDIQRPARRLN
ncbi:MAG: hypothetical protein LBV80_11620 [Deltaproteobacteria bacterium]|jgi:hypothetical protein|nr:hypothetical protein [Deltaproteobacteria bacterium]